MKSSTLIDVVFYLLLSVAIWGWVWGWTNLAYDVHKQKIACIDRGGIPAEIDGNAICLKSDAIMPENLP
jgi:hypothetical protein